MTTVLLNQSQKKKKKKKKTKSDQQRPGGTSRPDQRAAAGGGQSPTRTQSRISTPSHSTTNPVSESRISRTQEPPAPRRTAVPPGRTPFGHAERGLLTRYHQRETPAPARTIDRSNRVIDSMAVDELRREGRYVDQNAPAHIGRDLVYTYNISTCTALAMYSRRTGEALLFHADATSDPAPLAQDIRRYAELIRRRLQDRSLADSGTQIVLFCADDTLNAADHSSLTVVEDALRIAFADEPEVLEQVLYHSGGRAYDVDRDSYIMVGGGYGPCIALAEGDYTEYIIRRYTSTEADASAVEDHLITVLARSGSVSDLGRAVRYDIYERARKLGHEDVIALIDPDGSLRAMVEEAPSTTGEQAFQLDFEGFGNITGKSWADIMDEEDEEDS